MSNVTLRRNGKIINKKYFEYFWPTVLTAMANNIAVMVDTILVGNMVGSTSMAAINLLSPVVQLYFSMTILFGLGSSAIISYAKGNNDKASADKTFTVTFVSLITLCAVLMVVQFIFIDNIASILTTIPKLKSELILYYIPVIAGTPFSLLLPSVVHCIRSDGRPKFASNLIIISNAVNLVMDVVLMGPFQMGIIGSSIATVIGNAIAFVIMLTHFKNLKNTLHFDFSIFKNPREFFGKFVLLFTTGLSGALGTLLITVKMFFLNDIIQDAAGAEGMVAMSVISMCQIFISAFITGASQTMIPIVSVLLGEGDFEGIKYAFKKAAFILIVSSIVIMMLIEVIPGTVAKLFGDLTEEELLVVVPALRITSLSFPGLSLSFLLMYYYMATKKRFIAVIISVVNGIVLIIPFAYILGAFFGIDGIWDTFVVAQYGTLVVIACIVFPMIMISKGKYRNFYLLEENSVNDIMSFTVAPDFSDKAVKEYITEELSISDSDTKIRIADCVNDMLSYIRLCDEKKNRQNETDVRIRYENNEYILFVRNDGDEFNPDEPLLKSHTYKKIDYAYVLGMNQIKIIV